MKIPRYHVAEPCPEGVRKVLDGRIRRIVECEIGEEQQGFRRGRGTADGMFTLRHLVEKKLEGQENMALGIIDLETAYDTVLRDMAMATLRWVGVPEAEVRMVEGTYEETKDRVVCGPGISEEFSVDVGLRQGSALSPLLLFAVVEVVNRKASTRDILRKLLYADDLAVVADSEANLQERLVDWKEIFGKHGQKISLEKTEVLWVGQQKKDFDIKLDRKKLNQQDSFVYLGGAVCGDGSTETAARRRQHGDGSTETAARRRQHGDGSTETAARRLTFAGEYKLEQVRGGKWNG